MKQHFILLPFLLFALETFSQNNDWVWAKSSFTNYPSTFVSGRKVVTDASGNTYVAGMFYETDIGFDTIALYNTGGNIAVDIFIIKYNKDGDVQWARQIGGTGNSQLEFISDMHMDAKGNIFICGYFTSQNLKIGHNTLKSAYTSYNDAFIAKLDQNGNFAWAKSFTGSYDQNPNSIRTDAIGNIYLSGSFNNAYFTLGTTTLKNKSVSTEYDAFITQLNDTGKVLWAKSFGGNHDEFITAMAVSPDGTIQIAGTTSSDSFSMDSYKLKNGSMFHAKIDNAGNVVNAAIPGFGSINALVMDPSGNTYIGGNYISDSVKFGNLVLKSSSGTNNNGNFFILKSDASNNGLWIKNGTGTRVDAFNEIKCIAIDSKGNIYASGTFTDDSLTIGPTLLLNPTGMDGSTDIFIVRLDPSGSIARVKKIGGISSEEVFCTVAEYEDNIIFTGTFDDPECIFGNNKLHTANPGGSEMFLAKLSSNQLGINENNLDNNIRFFPNPVNDYLKISAAENKTITHIEIMNSLGQTIILHEIAPDNASDIQLDISSLSNGIYVIKCTTGKNSFYGKFIKQ